MTYAAHGLGLLLIFSEWFRYGRTLLGLVQGLPAWVQAKIGIWLLFGSRNLFGKTKRFHRLARCNSAVGSRNNNGVHRYQQTILEVVP